MKNEALKLALEALESADWYINQLEITLYSADDAGTHEDRLKVQQAITVLRLEIDAQNMSSKPVPENFIDALRFDTAVRDVDALVALARADEREACAKVCEDNSASYSERASRPEKVRDINPEVARVAVQTCGHVAAAIRARGNT